MRRKTDVRKLLLAFFISLVFVSPVVADTINIGERAGDNGYIHDNQLSGFNPDLNAGNATGSAVGEFGGNITSINRADLTGLPDGAVITGIVIHLYCDTIATGVTFQVFEIHPDMQDWVEGTNAEPATNESCYSHHTFNGTPWNSGGCLGAGTDYINTLLGSQAVAGTGAFTITLNAAGAQAFQNRLDEGDIELVFRDDNFTAGEYITIGASEHGTDARRPRITVTYYIYMNAQLIRR